MPGEPIAANSSSVSTIRVARLARDGERIAFRASEPERTALAARLGILAVERFEAELVAAPWRSDGVSVNGTLKAVTVQESVVTLEPIHQSISERVALTFVPDTSQLAKPAREEPAELELDPEGDDPPEVFSGDTIDLGSALEELLALCLDPYPRAGSESFASDEPEAADEAPGKVSPFAVLASIKTSRKDG